MAKEKKRLGIKRLESDIGLKQDSIQFTSEAITSEDMGMGSFKFASLTQSQLSPSEPQEDEGRLYIRDTEGVLYYIKATRVG
jgi:hypothetical protein